jgi:hypothetical protein
MGMGVLLVVVMGATEVVVVVGVGMGEVGI